MARRRKYRKKNNIEFNPEKIKEIVGFCLGILGVVLVLSIFEYFGTTGEYLSKLLDQYFGYVGYFLPFVLLIISATIVMPDRFEIPNTSYFGIIIALICIPAVAHPYGGDVGEMAREYIDVYVGPIGSFVVSLILAFVGLLIAFNMSINDIRERFFSEDENKANVKIHGTSEPQAKVSVFATVKDKMGFNNKKNPQQQPQISSQEKVVVSPVKSSDWQFPSLDLLQTSNTKASPGNISRNVEVIQKALRDFSIDVSMGDVNVGPTVTQYTLKPKEGIKLNQITARNNDLALALAAHPIRIEAPIPGKAAVGIEIPNKVAALVTLREILESNEYKNKKSNLAISLGRDVAGGPVITDLKKMPHLLIAGSTGSGKSICLNGVITSLLYQNSPEDLRLILIDPKRVEFTRYNDIPHLLCPVITEVDKTVNALKWTVAEMDRRFKLFASSGRRDIESYNSNPIEGKLPYLVVVIDELADLMAQSAREVEAVIVRLAQMARATGIHLIVATQRPSVDVITGLIKANIISRIAFAVASQIDSRTILDMSGAEKLLGNGDMLHVSSELGKPKRIQGVFISEKEVQEVTDFMKRQTPAQYDESILNYSSARSGTGGAGGEIDDDLFNDAKEVVVQAGKGSASLLQRRLRVGYARAARLLDILEAEGVIGPADGAKPRDVLISTNELALEHQVQQEQYQRLAGNSQQIHSAPNFPSYNSQNQQKSEQSNAPEELTEVDLRK